MFTSLVESLVSTDYKTSSPDVVHWACTAIFYLAKGHDSQMFKKKFIASGVCELVAKAMMKFSESELVSYACCRAFVVLLLHNDAYKIKLGKLGICVCIVESLHLFPSSARVAKWGCRAASVMAENIDSNIYSLGSAGACETIPIIIQSHQLNDQITAAGCDIITFMSKDIHNGFAHRFGHAGGCEAVVYALKNHIDKPMVVSRACTAMASLARLKGNSSWLGPAGACEALVDSLKRHRQNVDVVRFILTAIGSLCILESNKERLATFDICEDAIDIVNMHIADLETIKSGILLIGKLCEETCVTADNADVSHSFYEDQNEHNPYKIGTPSTQNGSLVISNSKKKIPAINLVTNRQSLFEAGCCNIINKSLKIHWKDADLVRIACRAISIIAGEFDCDREREEFGRLDVCELLAKCLKYHDGNEDIAKYGSLTIKSLAFQSNRNKMALYEFGVPKILVSILRGYRYSTYKDVLDFDISMSENPSAVAITGMSVIDSAAWAIANLAMHSQENRETLGEESACEGLLEILELHCRNKATTYYCKLNKF